MSGFPVVDVPGIHVPFFADMALAVKWIALLRNSRPGKIPTHKWLAVGRFYYYYTPTKDAPPDITNHSVKVPSVQIKGRWLNEAGFAIGAKVRVRVCQGCLVMAVEK